MSVMTRSLQDLIAEELDDLVDIRHDLHAHPELGYLERRTSGVVQEQLRLAGIEFKAGLAETGVLAHLPGAGNRAMALRADMDALPIQEETDLPYRSRRDGIMHACGHDGHTTILLGAARVLARIAAEGGLPRPVTFVFQPAEEGGAGGERMVSEGCLDGSVIGPPVENIFGLHGWPRIPLGLVSTRPGPMLAAADTFDITVEGRGSHAAWPHVGRDPVVAASAIVTALQTIASRNVGALDSIVVSTTQFHAGTAYNIIPDRVRLAGTVRTLVPETRELAEIRLTEIAEHVASAHGCRAEVDYELGYPVTVNDPEAYRVWHDVAVDTFGRDRVVLMEHPAMGGEDFSFYGKAVPACFFALGLIPDGAERVPDLHQPTFDFNDDGIPLGVELFCRLALR